MAKDAKIEQTARASQVRGRRNMGASYNAIREVQVDKNWEVQVDEDRDVQGDKNWEVQIACYKRPNSLCSNARYASRVFA